MKGRILFIFLFTLILGTSRTDAQTFGAKDAFAFRGLLMDFSQPVTGKFAPFDSLKGGVEMSYIHNLTQGLNLAIPLRFGITGSSDNRADGNSRGFWGGDALLQLDGSFKHWIVTPHLFTGIGTMYTTDDGKLNVQMPIGAGLNIKLVEGFYLTVQTEYRIGITSKSASVWHHSLGVSRTIRCAWL